MTDSSRVSKETVGGSPLSDSGEEAGIPMTYRALWLRVAYGSRGFCPLCFFSFSTLPFLLDLPPRIWHNSEWRNAPNEAATKWLVVLVRWTHLMRWK